MQAKVSPEFIQPSQVKPLFGISRSLAFELMAKGLVKSHRFIPPGRKQAIRLIDVASLRAHLTGETNTPATATT